MAPTTVVSALWLIWLAGWVLAAASTAKTVARGSPGLQLAYGVFIWAGAALLFFDAGHFGFLQHPPISRGSWVLWVGVFLVAAGLGFSVWARAHLGRLWSGNVTLKEEHAIVRTGPYALTRHPIYTGLLLALIGTVLVRGTAAALIGYFLCTLGVMIKARQEERLLTEHFGDDYRAYRAEVPALVPRPWSRRAG